MRPRIIGTASSTLPAPTRRPTTSTSTARRPNREVESTASTSVIAWSAAEAGCSGSCPGKVAGQVSGVHDERGDTLRATLLLPPVRVDTFQADRSPTHMYRT